MISSINILFLVLSIAKFTLARSAAADLGTIATSSNDITSAGGVTSLALPYPEEATRKADIYWTAKIDFSYYDDDDYLEKVHRGEIGKFGEGKILNVTGLLVHIKAANDVTNNTGCSAKFNTKDIPPANKQPWIALMRRGHCNFEVKVQNAYDHGAIGAIIYNDNREDQKVEKMKIENKTRHITSVFISYQDGSDMVKLIDNGRILTVNITEGTKHITPAGNINRTSVLFVSISFIVLMIISLVWLIFYYIQRFRYLQTKDKQSRRLCNVAKRIIAKIPTKSIKADDKEVDNDCCAICIEPYKVTDLIRVLPCKHEFHKSCIDPWLLEHRTCPMCKMDILKHYGFVFTGSQESILQLDMDAEEGDGDTISISIPRRDGVSPLPEIPSMDIQISAGSPSLDSDSDRDNSSPNETTPSLKCNRNAGRYPNKNPELCVACIATALSKHQQDSEGFFEIQDESLDHVSVNDGPSSLPTTLKKYSGRHSTRSCSGAHHHKRLYPHQKQPPPLPPSATVASTSSTTQDPILSDDNSKANNI